jgi:hypothetical protein
MKLKNLLAELDCAKVINKFLPDQVTMGISTRGLSKDNGSVETPVVRQKLR